MAFDHLLHILHPETGFQVHKDSGLHVGVDAVPPARVSAATDYPRWVKPHESHLARTDRGISAPLFPDRLHVDRVTGEATVLVHDKDEEKAAMVAPEPATTEPADPGLEYGERWMPPGGEAAGLKETHGAQPQLEEGEAFMTEKEEAAADKKAGVKKK